MDRTEGKARQAVEIATMGDVEGVAAALTAAFSNLQKASKTNGERTPSEAEILDIVRRAAAVNHVDPDELFKRIERT